LNAIVGKGDKGLNETVPILEINKAVITQKTKNIEDAINKIIGNHKILV
jgi:hypothetical protein